jgi:hypothetical protein
MFITPHYVAYFASLSARSLPRLEAYLRRRRKIGGWYQRWFILKDGFMYMLHNAKVYPIILHAAFKITYLTYIPVMYLYSKPTPM